MNKFLVRLIVFISSALLSFSSFSQVEDLFLIDLKNKKVEIEVNKIDGDYYFSKSEQRFLGQDILLGDNQISTISGNESNYPDVLENDINYKLIISNTLVKKLGYSANQNVGNNIILTTTQEDNSNYSFILVYSYKNNKIVLTDVLYLEENFDKREGENTIYKVNVQSPESIINLENYDRRALSDFIVNNLYKSVQDMTIDINL
ncbi:MULTISPECIES: hypothetical protein [Vibrio]|jgi:hypothetical protein|uniref:hypothetical protein n=1 Tax=Vibrio TaxID=662 RepID=UPI000DF3794E|nr:MULTISPECIES: hypothetical protein [unclassified Vibrio]MCF7369714.1 hypothetical protein [Vibrio sp. J2-3(2022)]MCF7478865.1 hypothetical protein [Vibrio sp. J2-4]RCW20929.1 hypothetical protein DET53_10935 [Vibrio parahaemolyticus]HDU8576902.1 hypothetical protein [Vibrio diabolicus]